MCSAGYEESPTRQKDLPPVEQCGLLLDQPFDLPNYHHWATVHNLVHVSLTNEAPVGTLDIAGLFSCSSHILAGLHHT
jgi:hypothetical protein